jgi:hypothetical protein
MQILLIKLAFIQKMDKKRLTSAKNMSKEKNPKILA